MPDHKHIYINISYDDNGRALDTDVCKICNQEWWKIQLEEKNGN